MTTAYSALSRAQLSFDYLHTNSTTHEFLFGGLAELVDNARDASAKKIEVYTTPDDKARGGFLLNFLDDGSGMNPDECADIITFGRSVKRSLDSNMIGMYGNGLKSGTMRIGKDFILFTKKGKTMSCLFLSRTFHEDEGIEEVIVPLPSFEMSTKKPLSDNMERHKMEMDLILKYSPFKTEQSFFEQFAKIPGTGTLVTVYNVKLLDDGQPELDVTSDQYDILLSNGTGVDGSDTTTLVTERRSFRSYTSILYADPWMKIYIQGKKVRTKRLASCLYKPRMYKYCSARFKTRAEADARKALEESKIIEEKAKEAETKAKLFEAKMSRPSKEERVELRILQTCAANLKKEAQLKKQMADRKSKSLKEPKTLHFIFGMNIDDRNQDGVFIYNCSRLIKMYTKVGPQTEGGTNCSGVMGTVDIPYLVLEPTHNKQDFADSREYRYLLKALGEHMVQYWKDVGIEIQGVTRFCLNGFGPRKFDLIIPRENFGYVGDKWQDPPSDDPKYLRKRAMQVPITLQCDSCLKWRILQFSNNNLGRVFPDKWICSMNPDPQHNTCKTQEQQLSIAEGVLRKEGKSKEQKQQDLEEEIRKKQEQLEKIQKVKTVTSDYQARQLEKEREEERKIQEAERRELEEEKKLEAQRRARELQKKKAEAEKKRQAELEKRRKEVIARQKAALARQKSQPAMVPTPRRAVITPKQPIRKPLPLAAARRRGQPSESEESEESEEEKPARRTPAKPTPSPVRTERMSENSVTSPRTAVKRSLATVVEEEPPIKRPTAERVPDTSATSVPASVAAAAKSEESTSDQESERIPCEAIVQDIWYPAKIVQVNKKTRKWKVKFDRNPKDKYDKWFDFDSSDVKFPKGKEPSHLMNNHEPPTSSTSNDVANKLMEPIAEGYRTCLRYFLPPQWGMEKETISQLTCSELASFPLDDFFDHYEKGLRKLVNNFQAEAQNKQREADQANTKLSHLRKQIAKLLKTINDDFDIDADADSEQVDELLAACLKQAMDSSHTA